MFLVIYMQLKAPQRRVCLTVKGWGGPTPHLASIVPRSHLSTQVITRTPHQQTLNHKSGVLSVSPKHDQIFFMLQNPKENVSKDTLVLCMEHQKIQFSIILLIYSSISHKTLN